MLFSYFLASFPLSCMSLKKQAFICEDINQAGWLNSIFRNERYLLLGRFYGCRQIYSALDGDTVVILRRLLSRTQACLLRYHPGGDTGPTPGAALYRIIIIVYFTLSAIIEIEMGT